MSLELRPIEKLPESRRQVGSMYDEILEEFLKSQMKYAEVFSKKNVKTVSLGSGLKSRIKKKQLQDQVRVRVEVHQLEFNTTRDSSMVNESISITKFLNLSYPLFWK